MDRLKKGPKADASPVDLVIYKYLINISLFVQLQWTFFDFPTTSLNPQITGKLTTEFRNVSAWHDWLIHSLVAAVRVDSGVHVWKSHKNSTIQ